MEDANGRSRRDEEPKSPILDLQIARKSRRFDPKKPKTLLVESKDVQIEDQVWKEAEERLVGSEQMQSSKSWCYSTILEEVV
ncbi:hypothetical protein E3N88_46210 [Mikania micrantha]|uniref:Uncharacterized protein n=1 Tax=Mikania micrantha TaxID=192012 RepID=A0A5N6L722_9ASTR|nr:hypothetical protein E3N88_46210 [Mikania micrantha]